MTLRSFSPLPFLAVLSVVCFGLILSGCDSGGSSTDDSDAPSQTFEVTLEAVDTPAEGLIKGGVYEGAENEQDPQAPPLQPGERFYFHGRPQRRP